MLAAPAAFADGGACPLPLPPDWRFLFPLKMHPPSQTTPRGQELAAGCRPGHPPCARGARSPAGPRPPARPGAAAFAAASLGVFVVITRQRSQTFRPNAAFGTSAASSTCTWLREDRDRHRLSAGFGRSRPKPPLSPWQGGELGFVVAAKADCVFQPGAWTSKVSMSGNKEKQSIWKNCLLFTGDHTFLTWPWILMLFKVLRILPERIAARPTTGCIVREGYDILKLQSAISISHRVLEVTPF